MDFKVKMGNSKKLSPANISKQPPYIAIAIKDKKYFLTAEFRLLPDRMQFPRKDSSLLMHYSILTVLTVHGLFYVVPRESHSFSFPLPSQYPKAT